MIKRKLYAFGLATAMTLALTACGGQQAPVTVVSTNETTEVTSEPEETTEPVVEEVTEEPEETEGTGHENPNLVEYDGEDKEETADQEVVDDIKERTGYDDLLVGTQVGISGTNVYVMVDGEGLLFDFNGLGMLMEVREGENLVGAKGMTSFGIVTFRGFCGEANEDRKGYKSLGTLEVGDLTVDRYWSEEFGIYEAYCKELDCSVTGLQGSFDYDSKEVLDSFDALVESNLKYFNANN